MTLFKFHFLEVGILDVLDILIVAYILYRFLLLMKGTRAVTMLVGLVLILFFAFVATWLNMNSLRWIIARLGTVWVIAFLIVFQPELRNVLTRLGNTPLFRRFVGMQERKIVASIVEAAEMLSDSRIGALIAIKRDVGLKSYEETGKRIDASVTQELLVTLFAPKTPLHDGAVIIEGDTIVAAACELPLTTNPRYQKMFGMRHRAGIGLAEETDAVVVIVSEETGTISIALRGRLRRGLSPENLRKILEVALRGRSE